MAKSMKLTTKETDFDEDVLTDLTGKRWDERSSEKAFSRFEKVLFATASAARKKSLQDVSFDEVIARKLDMTSPLHHLHLSGLEFELGAPLRNCSATECIDDDWFESVNGVGDSNSAHLPSYDEPCDLVLPEGGFSELFAGIASGAAFEGTTMQPWLRQPEHAKDRMPLNVRLNQEVISISQREVVEGDTSAPGGGVVVVTAKCLDPSTAPSEVLDTASPATPLAASCDNSATYGDSAPAGVDTISAQYTADAVIVTVPLGVLKAGSITFTPPLSTAKQQAIAEVGFGNVVKVIIEFPQVFWPTHTPFLSLADAALANPLERGLLTYFLNGHFIAGKKVLVGYGLGEAAATVDEVTVYYKKEGF